MSDKTTKKGKKGRKHGRQKRKPSYQKYNRVKNKARKLYKYMKKFPNWKPTNLSKEIEAEIARLKRKEASD